MNICIYYAAHITAYIYTSILFYSEPKIKYLLRSKVLKISEQNYMASKLEISFLRLSPLLNPYNMFGYKIPQLLISSFTIKNSDQQKIIIFPEN